MNVAGRSRAWAGLLAGGSGQRRRRHSGAAHWAHACMPALLQAPWHLSVTCTSCREGCCSAQPSRPSSAFRPHGASGRPAPLSALNIHAKNSRGERRGVQRPDLPVPKPSKRAEADPAWRKLLDDRACRPAAPLAHSCWGGRLGSAGAPPVGGRQLADGGAGAALHSCASITLVWAALTVGRKGERRCRPAASLPLLQPATAAAAAEMDAAGEGVTCSLGSLPDFLLARIMVLTGWEHR